MYLLTLATLLTLALSPVQPLFIHMKYDNTHKTIIMCHVDVCDEQVATKHRK